MTSVSHLKSCFGLYVAHIPIRVPAPTLKLYYNYIHHTVKLIRTEK